MIYRTSSNDLVCKHTLLKEIGKTSSLPGKEMELLSEKQAIAFLESSKYGIEFVEELRKSSPRYVDTQLRRLVRLSSYYTAEQIEVGLEHCVKSEIYTVFELTSYLLFHFGDIQARKYLSNTKFSNYKKRADRIQEEEHGRY